MEKKRLPEPMDIGQQIENLKSLGLIIRDEKYAAKFLDEVSYFRFVKAYSLGLKPRNGAYYDGVSFEQMVELYRFNSRLRQLLFAEIEKVEVTLRCRLANYISLQYGVLGYQSSNIFVNEAYHSAFLQDIEAEIIRNKRTPYIKNFQRNYENGDIPIYALVEIFSFGTLSKFYKNMKNQDKKNIAQGYGVPYPFLESWFESLAYVRNLCAHYGRLYNAKLTKTPKLYRQDRELGIVNDHIFATLCCLKYLLPHNGAWRSFVDVIAMHLEKFPHVQKETMGFPDGWQDILLGRK